MKKLALLLTLAAKTSYAQQILEIATIIPDETTAASDLKHLSKQVADTSEGALKLRFQWGGLAGDDKSVLDQLRTGKLAGAMLAGQILSDVAPGIRDTERLFQFGSDRGKAWSYATQHQKSWDAQLNKKELHNLGLYEAGFVYLVSKKPFTQLKDIKTLNIWSWPGDKMGQKTISVLGGKAVEVEVQDTFKALADGRIDMAYAPPIAIVALQWMSKVTHMVEQPIAYAVGAFVLTNTTWKKLTPSQQKILTTEATKSLELVNKSTQKDNDEALAMLTASGLKTVRLPESDIKQVKGK